MRPPCLLHAVQMYHGPELLWTIGLCEGRPCPIKWKIAILLKYGLRSRVSMQARPHPQVLSMMPPEWFVLLFLIVMPQHNGTKSNRCSSMASASEWACEVCPCLNTMEQRAIVAQVWPLLPSECASQALILRCCQWCPRNDSYYYSS